MNNDALEILDKLFKAGKLEPEGVNAKKFRAINHVNKDLIDDLENKQYITRDKDKYFVSLIALSEMVDINNEANRIMFLCELIFNVLKQFYLENAGDNISLNELASIADIPRSDVNKAFPYFIQCYLYDGRSTNVKGEDESTISPGEKILDFNSFKEAVDDLKKIRESSKGLWNTLSESSISENRSNKRDYIHGERIIKLNSLTSGDFDFRRLIQICSEINSCAQNGNNLGLIALTRILLDHVPPIFGMSSFKEVAANYKSGRSLKKTLERLENSSRNIADGIIHQPIRKKESLPTFNQVDFSQDIDRLLEEVIRITEENAAS